MTYDILIKNGLIVDGSGGPSYRGDVGVKDGKIVEIGKLSGPATRTVDAGGQVVAPELPAPRHRARGVAGLAPCLRAARWKPLTAGVIMGPPNPGDCPIIHHCPRAGPGAPQ